MFNSRLGLIDAFSGATYLIDTFPFQVGADEESDLRLVGIPANSGFIIRRKGLKNYVMPIQNGETLFLNGAKCEGALLEPNRDYSLVVEGHYFIARVTGNPNKWMKQIHVGSWMLEDINSRRRVGPVATAELFGARRMFPSADSLIVFPAGAFSGAFWGHVESTLRQFGNGGASEDGEVLRQPRAVERPIPSQAVDEPAPVEIDVEHGELTCPTCWLHFDHSDAMNIATHASLRGDSKLGQDDMQRFVPLRFNDAGIALDAMSIPSPNLACPHCHRKLPTGFLEDEHHIFSIVGAPSSGKSYYLAILVRELQDALFKNFNIAFRDADPTQNRLLNDMKNRLASGGSPQDVALPKTALEGGMYEKLPRYGQMVALPKPFVYRLTPCSDRDANEVSIIFYDNAGEHFQPGRNSADSPGAQHVASASAIFFLFDPLNSNAFRNFLNGNSDPGANLEQDQQDVILAETETRMKDLLGLGKGGRAATPLAFMVGKGDALEHLLPPDEMEPIVVDGKVDAEAVDRNSEKVRSMLTSHHSAVVANAESISSNVRYFLVSAFGAPPIRFKMPDGSFQIGPDPAKIRPRDIEHPTLWALSQIAPDLVPSVSAQYQHAE